MASKDITPMQIDAQFDYFVSYPTPKSNPMLLLGQELIQKHGWVCFDYVKAQPATGNCGLRRGYFGFASPKAAEVFLREKKFPTIKTCTFYSLQSDFGTSRYELQNADDDYRQKQRDLRSKRDFERKLATSAAMIAQKVLGEHVFAMVRRSREMRMGVTA